MSKYFLLKHLVLDNFAVKLYGVSDSSNIIDDLLEPIMQDLNQQAYPRGIVEKLQTITNIVQIEVYNSQGSLLLNSFIAPDEQQ